MHSRYIYIGLNKNMLTENCRKKCAEKIYRKKESRKIIRQHLAAQLGLATTPRPHHRQYLPLPDINGRSALSALSIPESHPHPSHHKRIKATGHIPSTTVPKITLLWGEKW
jgi:hypothetical protein